MYYKFILFLSILATMSFSAYGQAVETANANINQITTCPEIEKMDIFFITRFLSGQRWRTERKKVGIKDYTFNRSELGKLGSNTPENLREYWKKRGVVIVSNPEICRHIEETLSTDNRLDEYEENYRKVYFKEKDKFIIHYDPNNTRIDGPSIPTVILNDNFNIIGYFKQ